MQQENVNESSGTTKAWMDIYFTIDFLMSKLAKYVTKFTFTYSCIQRPWLFHRNITDLTTSHLKRYK